MIYKTPAPADDDLRLVAMLAERQRDIESDIADLEARLEAKREQLRLVCERELPDAMLACGMTDFRTTSGRRIKLVTEHFPSIPNATKPAAFEWLRSIEKGDLIKRTVKVEFGMGEDNAAGSVVAAIGQALRSVGLSDTPVEDRASIHASTLKAFVRESLTKGVEFPDSFAITTVRRSVIVEPKEESKI